MRRILHILLLLAVAFATVSLPDEADARRRRRPRARRLKVINEKKLYERIGSSKGVSEIVDEWLRLSLADNRISGTFARVAAKPQDLAKLRRSLGDRLCDLADGPCQYKGPDIRKAPDGSDFEEIHFLAFAENLFKSMQKTGVPEREKNEVLGRIGEIKTIEAEES